jgi:hypothetical protein
MSEVEASAAAVEENTSESKDDATATGPVIEAVDTPPVETQAAEEVILTLTLTPKP